MTERWGRSGIAEVAPMGGAGKVNTIEVFNVDDDEAPEQSPREGGAGQYEKSGGRTGESNQKRGVGRSESQTAASKQLPRAQRKPKAEMQAAPDVQDDQDDDGCQLLEKVDDQSSGGMRPTW